MTPAAQFCFFAHAPEELRGPVLAVHVKPGEAVQHAKQELNPAEDTAGKIQVSRGPSLIGKKGRRRKGSVGQDQISIL
jgi:hypothetical protein